MAILDKVKKNISAKKDEKVASEKAKSSKFKVEGTSKRKRIYYDVIKKSLVTEKSATSEDMNKLYFEVKKDTTKNELKKACESFYKMKVLKVNVMTTPSKTRRRGMRYGLKKGYKKAIVTFADKVKV